jgi:hypothetical protein
MISPIKSALVNLLRLLLAPFAPRGSALEEERKKTDSGALRTPPSMMGDDPESILQWLARGRTILAGYRRDFGPDSWLTKNQAEYVRQLERMLSKSQSAAGRSPRHSNDDGPPRMADGV